jgi:hypothetical protein
MPTFSDMVEEVRSNLQGYTLRQDRITYLANAIDADDTAIKVGSSSNLAKGMIEVDDELIWIDNFDKASATMNALPGGFGRGYQGSVAASHAQYAPVTLSPTFPRKMIKQAINDVLASLYPKLWGTNKTTFTFNAAQNTYGIPSEAESLLYVSWQTPGASKEWINVKRWREDHMANTDQFPTGHTITIYDGIQPGRTVQVYYTVAPQLLVNNSDDFATVTGLPESAFDVVIYGACYRLLTFLDAGRINLSSAEADTMNSKIPSNAGTNVSRYIFALYQQRLQEESIKLTDSYPTRVHYIK